MGTPRIPLEPETFYHIFNHAIGNEDLFNEQKNYHRFLANVEKWILPICDLHAFCLMPNHFHLVVKIFDEKNIMEFMYDTLFKRISKSVGFNQQAIEDLIYSDTIDARILRASTVDKLINEQFSHCFNSYVQAYNKTYNRQGSLMRESFKRNKIDSDNYLRTAICYLHNNPVLHGFVHEREDWNYSSYNLILDGLSGFRKRDEVIELFDGVENFKFVHQEHLVANR